MKKFDDYDSFTSSVQITDGDSDDRIILELLLSSTIGCVF